MVAISGCDFWAKFKIEVMANQDFFVLRIYAERLIALCKNGAHAAVSSSIVNGFVMIGTPQCAISASKCFSPT